MVSSRALLAPLALLFLPVFGCAPAHLAGDGGVGDGDGGLPPGRCGDMRVNAGEDCDDGNEVDGDGCSAECTSEIPEGCGDGVVEGVEDCDDGNNEGGDGCGPGCWIEGCGNTFLDPGEACEDGNREDGDGCSADCRSDESCGNGIVDTAADEMCDDGNGDDTDECPATCEPARCGDGFVRKGHETCDDGNDVAEDGCTSCTLDSCGDGSLDEGEECDLGVANGMAGTSCFATCITTEVTFDEPISVPLDPGANGVAVTPRAVETADLNGDGRLDLATSNSGSTDVTTLYGFGDGRFWAPHLQSDSIGGDVALADVNGDGVLDAVSAGAGGFNTISVLLGDGDGFGEPETFLTEIDIGGEGPTAVAIAELTGDSFLDVVTANQITSDVTLLAGDGEGGFAATSRLSTLVGEGGESPRDIAVGDVTGDGTLDIVTANQTSDDVAVFAGMGGGNFAAADLHTTRVGANGDGPLALAVVDVSNDGVPDVVTANANSDDVTVLAADGEGGLGDPLRFSTLEGETGRSPRGIAVSDVNADGFNDLVVPCNSDDVVVLESLGPGVAFDDPLIMPILNEAGDAGNNPEDVAVADFDGDGNRDLLVVNQSSNDLTVLLGTGGGEFADPISFASNPSFDGFSPVALAVSDVNDDGALDATVVTNGALMVLAGLGDGGFAPPQSRSVSGSGHLAIGDVHGDGRPDLLAASSTQVRLLTQAEDGTLGTVGLSSPLSFEVVAVAAADFDGDQSLDIISCSSSEVGRHINDGMGGFSVTEFAGASSCQHVVLADATGDDAVDILMATGSSDSIAISQGNGSGDFGGFSSLSTTNGSTSGQTPVFVAVADVNDDGKVDLLSANRDSNDVTLLLGQGSGSYDDPEFIPTVTGGAAASVQSVRVGDFNKDGLLDLATANLERDTVSVMLGYGDGGFAAAQTFAVGEEPADLAVGDFNGDGFDDVAAVSRVDSSVTVLLGRGHP